MEAYRFETVLEKDGLLTLANLPISAGIGVEVILLVHAQKTRKTKQPANPVDSHLASGES